ncbi:hypothetical protein GOPIP_074_00150 [Gordonia polyisoprenivorans NBRC 16320 = JCM 10675]|uniref:DUF6924 domain-containing protein n=1 Tax=Gordonia polyisoprenivorans TaxID=84595 RepID=A0A846WLQ3_9ACTN|nr:MULTISPECIES: hypothetical protein [Gordonia]NKY02528.1 hypothetical protein [Gordonia polyisoprenivorans]OPX15903.1 hypothetical protein B1964_07520 [Gordonia sp. i37]OZC30070.1 hypothetical protein CJJ17_00255 [Gordonia polyisoprenivorans]QUD80944.1 hypothetical protein J8M97_13850 [Gordonia polyisoprenivorans]UZF58348.1 hypothetical protein LH935_10425 [Gordonia polyisoprenivorans]
MALRYPLPQTNDALLVRTYCDPATDQAWGALVWEASAPVDFEHEEGRFRANFQYIDDRAYDGVTVDDIVDSAPEPPPFFVFVADEATLSSPDHAVLVVDLLHQPGRTVRVRPRDLWSVENNLSLGNMGFDDFARAAVDGVFPGFG